MKFGLFIIGDSDPELGLDLKGYYERMLEQVRWGESLGYECFWFGEHHFDFHGVIPTPTVLMSAAAACTNTIRLGVAVALLPYRDPVLTAEEYAMVDVLSGGRLDFGVGRGTPPELVGFGVKEDNRDRLVESLEVVEMAWREGPGVLSGTVPPHRRRVPERAPGPAALAAGVLRRPEPRLLPGGGGEGLSHHGHPLRELQGHGRGQAQGGLLQGNAEPIRPRPRTRWTWPSASTPTWPSPTPPPAAAPAPP